MSFVTIYSVLKSDIKLELIGTGNREQGIGNREQVKRGRCRERLPCKRQQARDNQDFFPLPTSLFPTPYSLLPTPYSLLPTPYSLKPRTMYLTKSQTAIYSNRYC
ncbi:MAG: hypothetical protein F6J90_07280 [Moorea sp. SIOASIH]|uniref:hypothetical protein n=1 Tax=Moorena sp. SIOASIH TaxID=2607817 RepID=UPI0013B722A9|nr:hypothetical protein [Moorena sp. SIOASIH]NEO36136.1 hypothetical protein [Moorena sp. SIOASIH]